MYMVKEVRSCVNLHVMAKLWSYHVQLCHSCNSMCIICTVYKPTYSSKCILEHHNLSLFAKPNQPQIVFFHSKDSPYFLLPFSMKVLCLLFKFEWTLYISLCTLHMQYCICIHIGMFISWVFLFAMSMFLSVNLWILWLDNGNSYKGNDLFLVENVLTLQNNGLVVPKMSHDHKNASDWTRQILWAKQVIIHKFTIQFFS